MKDILNYILKTFVLALNKYCSELLNMYTEDACCSPNKYLKRRHPYNNNNFQSSRVSVTTCYACFSKVQCYNEVDTFELVVTSELQLVMFLLNILFLLLIN